MHFAMEHSLFGSSFNVSTTSAPPYKVPTPGQGSVASNIQAMGKPQQCLTQISGQGGSLSTAYVIYIICFQ